MAFKIIRQALCDKCVLDGDEHGGVEVSSVIVGINGKLLQMELCRSHRSSLYDPFISLLEQAGRKPDLEIAPETEEDGRTCPVCHRVSASRGALSGHVRAQHNTTMSELLGKPPRGKVRVGAK